VKPYNYIGGRRQRAARRHPAAVFLLLTATVLLPPAAVCGGAASAKWLEFRGQVVIPPKAVLRGKRITVTLANVGTSFNARNLADFKGRFRFKKIPPGTYSVSFLIPGAGEMRCTVDVTHSFADAQGRVEKQFTFDADELAHETLPVQQGVVSVRELSIPSKARNEYSDARNDLRHQKVDSALRHLEKAVQIAPRFLEALNYLGVLAYQRNDYTAAIDYFRKALKLEPDAYEPLVNLGGALLSLGKAREALAINIRAQAARPKDALANSQLGLSYYLLGNDEEALNYLLLTEQLDPAHFSCPQIALANIYWHHSQAESALEELQDFLKYHPDSLEATTVRAMMKTIREAREPESAATAGLQ
jgi:Tfp pilus assembly protein PilF